MELNINESIYTVDKSVPQDTPLLWVLREELGLHGTKFGCGKALCGACTVHLDGQAIRSCVTPLSEAKNKSIKTIEGVATIKADGTLQLHNLQQAWVEQNVPQCGYCQPGQIMSALALLNNNPNPDDKAIDAAMSGNICRCGMYPRIKKAIKQVANR